MGLRPHRELADEFAALVRACDAAAEARWLAADDLGGLGKVGTLYLPGPGLGDAARLRLRAGPAAYSLCGVTHTTASHSAMHDIAGLLSAPVMPWDALICTSSAVAGTVRLLLHSEIEALRWRFGTALTVTLPQLPVIPLGVHCADLSTPRRSARPRAPRWASPRTRWWRCSSGGCRSTPRRIHTRCMRHCRRPRSAPAGGLC